MNYKNDKMHYKSNKALLNSKRRVIAILGPTATGKSKLAINLAKKFPGEIINADSRAFYKNLDIGTAKPKKDKKIPKKHQWIKKFKNQGPIVSKQIIHWLIDFASLKDPMTAAIYKPLAYEIIDNVLKRNKIPFLVGGSGLYVRAVLENFQIPIVIPDYRLRRELEKKSTKKLAQKLKTIDSLSYKTIDLKNRRRLIRAIEVAKHTGKSFIKIQKKQKVPFSVLKIGIKSDEKYFKQKIDIRVKEMINKGWIDEVKKLQQKKLDKTQIFQNTIGYPQLLKVIKKQMTLEDAIKDIQLKTRQFAKRQKTWFKKEKGIVWVENQKEAEEKVRKFLND